MLWVSPSPLMIPGSTLKRAVSPVWLIPETPEGGFGTRWRTPDTRPVVANADEEDFDEFDEDDFDDDFDDDFEDESAGELEEEFDDVEENDFDGKELPDSILDDDEEEDAEDDAGEPAPKAPPKDDEELPEDFDDEDF